MGHSKGFLLFTLLLRWLCLCSARTWMAITNTTLPLEELMEVFQSTLLPSLQEHTHGCLRLGRWFPEPLWRTPTGSIKVDVEVLHMDRLPVCWGRVDNDPLWKDYVYGLEEGWYQPPVLYPSAESQ